MAVTNLLKSQVDQPVFEWMRFAPTSASSASSFTFNQYTYGRYMYYQVSQAMWRYDTYSDSWQETSPPPATPSTISQIKHTDVFGYRGHTISATSTTITIAGFGNLSNAANGLKIRIIAGMGAGQERTITSSASAVIADFGVVSSASASAITDNTKKWRFNQWDGYQCRLTFNTGQTQIRKVQYNDTTTLTFSDTNFQPIDPFNNTGFSTVSPYAAPTNVGTVTGYVIESTTLTIDSAWTVTPDQSSIYMIMSGGVWYIANSSSTPFTSLHWYDILTDSWQSKTNVATFSATAGLNGSAGEFSIERLGETGGTYLFGSFTGGTAASGITMALSAGLTYETDRWANHKIEIINGKGIAQKRRIVGNNGFTFWINKKWDITPDSTSHFTVSPNSNYLWLMSGEGVGAMYAYAIEEDLWTVGPLADSGIARNFSATPYAGTTYGPPHEGFALSSIVRTTSGILSGTVNAGGTNYVIGDLVTCSTTGTNGTFFVTGINTSTGAVTSLELAASGSGYSAGSSSTTGGSGTGLTITLTVGTTALVTTATNHDFRGPSGGVVQETVTIAGCATDTTFNANFGVIGVGSLTTFSIAAPASAASPTAANSQSTTLLVDSTKNWATNELVGKLLFVQTAGTSPTVQGRKISANTATTISFSSSALSPAATNGTSRYSIQEPRLYGALVTNKIPNRVPYGWATSGTATTLVDTTKDWTRNQWINCRVRVVSGTGTGNESVITANSSNTLTVASWGVATPDTTSKYEILDSYGVYTAGAFSTVQTDSNKNYVTNSLTGKGIKLVTGLAIQGIGTITSNTATTITTSSTTFNTDTATHYCVIDIATRGQGFKFVWLHGLSDLNRRGRYLFANRGGAANGYDMYDIPSNTWDVTIFPQNGSITWTQGTMMAYDGLNSVFFIKDATGRIYEFDMSTFNINPSSIAPYPPSGSAYGNRMEILTTADGLKYLYVMRHLGQEMWRTLKFW